MFRPNSAIWTLLALIVFQVVQNSMYTTQDLNFFNKDLPDFQVFGDYSRIRGNPSGGKFYLYFYYFPL